MNMTADVYITFKQSSNPSCRDVSERKCLWQDVSQYSTPNNVRKADQILSHSLIALPCIYGVFD